MKSSQPRWSWNSATQLEQRGGEIELILSGPEFCYITGLRDAMMIAWENQMQIDWLFNDAVEWVDVTKPSTKPSEAHILHATTIPGLPTQDCKISYRNGSN